MMTKLFWIRVTVIAAFVLHGAHAFAQPKSLGVSFSYTGISISYEMYSNRPDSFIDIVLKSENSEFYSGRFRHPGISASTSFNYYLKAWTYDETNSVKLFAGPGLTIGYCPDYKTVEGIMFGLKGKLGVECTFERDVQITASIAPIVGSHIVLDERSAEMKYYRNGFQYGFIPEIGIKYRF